MQQTDIIPVLKEFYRISGFRISIHDLDYQEIYAYPQNLSPFCCRIQQFDSIRQKCRDMDRRAFERVRQSEDTFVYQCHCGLYEAVAPIYHFGVLSGFLMMGQVRSISSSRDLILSKLASLLPDSSDCALLVDSIHSVDDSLISSFVTIMQLVAEHITSSNRISHSSDRLAPLIKQYINRNFSRHISIPDLAQHFHCSSSTLMASFKAEYHLTIFSYLRLVRLSHAKQLLLFSSLSVKQISSSCGFSSQNYFSHLFSYHFGSSPASFRSSSPSNKSGTFY